MSRYPFAPELLDALPEDLAELFRGLEDTLLDEICSRLALKDQLNEVTVQAIRALRSHGIDTKEIEKAIRKTSGISEKKLKELFDDVIARNQKYYTSVIDMAGLTKPDILVNTATIEAIRVQTLDEFHNITQSMGFLVDKGRTMLPPARAYQWALDSAVMQIQSGAINYNQAIKSAVQQLAGGLKVVNYESGHVDNIDVAVRRAVMTGVNQICDQIPAGHDGSPTSTRTKAQSTLRRDTLKCLRTLGRVTSRVLRRGQATKTGKGKSITRVKAANLTRWGFTMTLWKRPVTDMLTV